MKHEKDYLDELQEWQENQFNPGHYIGNGKIPPYIKANGNPGLMAIVYYIGSIIAFGAGAFLPF